MTDSNPPQADKPHHTSPKVATNTGLDPSSVTDNGALNSDDTAWTIGLEDKFPAPNAVSSPYLEQIPVEIIDDSIPQGVVDDGSWQMDKDLGDGLPSDPEDVQDLDALWDALIGAKEEDVEDAATELALEIKEYLIAPRKKKEVEKDGKNNDGGPKGKESGAGEQLLFQVMYTGKGKRKVVGSLSDEMLVDILESVWQNFEKYVIGGKSEKVICGAFAFELIPCLLGVLLESKEYKYPKLEKVTKRVLFYCVKRASPKEAHLKIKLTLAHSRQPDSVVHFLSNELIELWTNVLARLEVKRMKPLHDAYKKLKRYRIVNYEDCLHVERGDDPPQFEVGMIGMVEALIKAQQMQLEAPQHQDPVKDQEYTSDLMGERDRCVSMLLTFLESLMEFLPERKDNEVLSNKEATALAKARAPFVSQIRRIMCLLAILRWKAESLIETLQIASGFLFYKLIHDHDIAVADASRLNPDGKARHRLAGSLTSFGVFLYVACGLVKDDNATSKNKKTLQSEDAVGVLDPLYVFDLALPGCIALCAEIQSTVACRGALLARHFLRTIPNESLTETRMIARVPFDERVKHYNFSYLSLGRALTKAASNTMDNKRRCVMYETLQSLILKFAKGKVRFRFVRTLLLETMEDPMKGQLVTELKDVLLTCEVDPANRTIVPALRWELARTVLPQYLVPRKDILSSLSVIVSVCNAVWYLSIRDTEHRRGTEDDTQARMKYVRMYARLCKEVLRSLAAVAEHDLKKAPQEASEGKEIDKERAKAVCDAAEKTINDCVLGISTLETSLQRLSQAIK